jgi:hypothetical protein
MTARIVLDTSAYAHFRACHRGVVDVMAKADVVQLPVTVLGELEAGFLLGRRVDENRSTLEQFLNEPWVSVLPMTQDVAVQYTIPRQDLRGPRKFLRQVRANGVGAPFAGCRGEALTVDTGEAGAGCSCGASVARPVRLL